MKNWILIDSCNSDIPDEFWDDDGYISDCLVWDHEQGLHPALFRCSVITSDLSNKIINAYNENKSCFIISEGDLNNWLHKNVSIFQDCLKYQH